MKLMDSMSEVASELSFFREVWDAGDVSATPRINAILKNIFEEILDYLTGIVRLFYKSNGSKCFQLLWKIMIDVCQSQNLKLECLRALCSSRSVSNKLCRE
jgi:hypothetical protein